MKKLSFFLIWFLCFHLPVAQATITPGQWEAILVEHLNDLLGSESFSIESLNASVGDRQLEGKGTFFGYSDIEFSVQYEGEGEIGFFEAKMPSNAKVEMSNKSLKNLAGQKLEDLIPNAIRKGVYLEKFNFQVSKKEKKVEQFHLWFNALRNWELFSTTNIELEQIKIDIQIDHPTQKAKRKTHGILIGKTTLAGKTLDLSADLTNKKEELELSGRTAKLEFSSSLQAIVGKSNLKGVSIPDNIISLDLKDALFTVAPYQDWISLVADSNFGQVDLWAKKGAKKKKTSYLITIQPPEGFKLSQINKNLKALDRIDLSGQKIVISSEEKSKKETSKIPSLAQASAAVKKGCNMVANIDLKKLKVDHLIGLKNLVVSSPLSDKIQHMALEGAIDKDISFGETAKLKQVIFRLKPAPSDFAISLLGQMDTQVQQDLLAFKGGVELVLADQTFNFLAMMDGDWNDPFGAKGLRVSDLGLQMGASFTTAPLLLPNIALAGNVKIGKFRGNAAIAFDTRNPTNCLLDVGFNEVILWDVVELLSSKQVSRSIPKEMKNTLREIIFTDVEMKAVPKSMEVLGRYYDAGFRAGGKMDVVGFKAEGLFDISFSSGFLASGSVDPIDLKIFKLKGANGRERPGLDIDLRKDYDKKFIINGEVGLLGVSGMTDIHIIDNGFQFMVGGKIFHLFAGNITASGTDMQRAGDMKVEVELENNFFEFLQKDVAGFVENATEGGVSKLRGIHADLAAAERAVQGWNKEIEKKRKEVSAKQAKHRKAFEAAQAAVNKEKTKVNKIKKDINANKKLAATKTKITQAHERAYLEGKIKTLEGKRLLALGALEAANLGLEGLKWVNKDPDLDPGVIALKGKKEMALKSVQGFRLLLKTTANGLEYGGGAATWILEKGTKGIVDIQEARFAGQLGTISGGAVELELKVAWMNKTQNLKVAFDFNNMVESAANVGKALLQLD
jgi:hypothetical protein